MEITTKIVDFTFCNGCEHFNKPDAEDPCHECLNEPARENSVRPINYKERKGIKND